MPHTIYTTSADWLGAVDVRLDSGLVRRVALAHASHADERGYVTVGARRIAGDTGLALKSVQLARAALIDAGLLVYLERTSADGRTPQQLQLPRP